MAEAITGKCLCGAVRFSAHIKARETEVCHCSMCCQSSGGISMLVECKALDVQDTEDLGLYHGSDWGERGFCKKCGASLFWRMQDGTNANVAFAALDDKEGFTFTKEIFVDDKPDCYSFAQATKKMTGAEVIALFTSGQEH